MKPIPGFPGYTITEEGVITNPKGKVLTRIDTWEGYHRARLKNEEGKFVNRKIHRLVALAHLGVKDGEIRHKDNNRANYHLHNLEWTDRTGNAADRLARGSYHLKTQLVGGKSLLILGDNKYLDPEAKKVYHVTDHPIGEDGVTPVTSLEKIARYSEKGLNTIREATKGMSEEDANKFKSDFYKRSFNQKRPRPDLIFNLKGKELLLEKTAKLSDDDLGRIQNILNNYLKHKQQEKKAVYNFRNLREIFKKKSKEIPPFKLIGNPNKKFDEEGFVRQALYKKAVSGDPTALSLMQRLRNHFEGNPTHRAHEYLKGQGFSKKASWTSKNNADKHAKKHAKRMGLSEEDYINAAVSSLKEKKALINIRGDVHKSRVGKNILVHKDDKVITYYSKVAYIRKIRKHLDSGIDNFKDWGYHQDAIQTHLDIKEKKKKK